MDTVKFVKLEVYANILEALNALLAVQKIHFLFKWAVKIVMKCVASAGDKIHASVGLDIDQYATWTPPEGMDADEFAECIHKLKHYCEARKLG